MSEKRDIVFCTGGGCTAKLGAGVLSRILEKLPRGAGSPLSCPECGNYIGSHVWCQDLAGHSYPFY